MWSAIKNLGTLVIGYTPLKILGAEAACLLSRLISEYGYAKRQGNNFDNTFFININELQFHLGFDEDELMNALVKL